MPTDPPYTSDAEVVRIIHPDLFGRQRGKQIAAAVVAESTEFAYSKMSLAEDILGIPVDEGSFPSVAGHPDLQAHIEPGRLYYPGWERGAVWALTRLTEHGKPSPLCVRSVLAKAEDLLAERGWRAIAAGEPEFYLFDSDARPYGGRGVSYTMDRVTDPRGSASRIHRAVIDFGIGVTAMNREFSTGQFEINVVHGPVLDAADRIFLLKTAVKELALAEGLTANFMAKPAAGEEGSSLHVHLSLWNDDGNLFADRGDRRGLSEIALGAIGGLQEHAAALSAFAAPTVNSYKRLVGEGLSPQQSTWGVDNRHAYLRVPAEYGDATRVELRSGDASASPHLLMAAMIHAALDGIDRGLRPTAEGRALPRTLEGALDALERDDALRTGIGDELASVYIAIKRAETQAFAAAVTDWEWRAYAEAV